MLDPTGIRTSARLLREELANRLQRLESLERLLLEQPEQQRASDGWRRVDHVAVAVSHLRQVIHELDAASKE
jgi:hypothetical protein